MKLSVITVNLNNKNGLVKTLDSLQNQTFRDFELIVIDGGSADGSREIMSSRNKHISHWVSEHDRGIYHAMNKGLYVAKGEYVQFLNSGDWLPESDVLASVFMSIEGNEDLIYGNALRTITSDLGAEIRVQHQPQHLTIRRFFSSGLCHQSIFYRRELFDKYGLYNEDFSIAGDWEFTIRLLMEGCKSRHLDIPVAHYEGGGISANQTGHTNQEKEKLLRQYLPPVIYEDYVYLIELEKSYAEVQKYKDWTEKIKNGSLVFNYAMVSKWFFERVKNKFVREKNKT